MVTPVKVTEVKRLSPHAKVADGVQDAHRRQVERVRASLASCPDGRSSREGRPNGAAT